MDLNLEGRTALVTACVQKALVFRRRCGLPRKAVMCIWSREPGPILRMRLLE